MRNLYHSISYNFLNLGYRETADGKVGISGGFGYSSTSGFSTTSIGYNYDTLAGGGVTVGYSETDSGSSIIDAINGQASWNANYGFQGSADLSFNPERLGNWIQGNGAYSDEQVALNRFEERYGDMKPTDKAFQKAALGLKLTDDDIKIISAEKEKRDKDAAAKKQQEQAQTKQKLDILRGVGKKNEDDKIIVQLKGNEKSEFLKEAQKFVIEKIKNAIKGEGEQYEVINKALKDFETSPNADTASKLIQAYEDTSAAIGLGFVPVAGDVIDGLIAIKDVHEKNYFAASISTAAFFLPLIPAPLAKKVIGKVKNKVADVVKESEIGKWLAGRFGKKVDEVVEQGAKASNGYDSLFDATIQGTTRSSHRYFANKEFYNVLKNDSVLKNQIDDILGQDVLKFMESGKGAFKNPPNTNWHHPFDNPKVLELLQKNVHKNPDLQKILHPNGIGGYGTYYGN